MSDPIVWCAICKEEREHLDLGHHDVPASVRYKCKGCGEYLGVTKPPINVPILRNITMSAKSRMRRRDKLSIVSEREREGWVFDPEPDEED